MHDYDVEALSLSAPPASAVIQAYRPAVSVRNNGVHAAYASGYLRIYAADLLIFETELYSATIAPGATGLAQAVGYWTPPAVGKYMIFGAVTCPLDQYEPNNNLAPVTIDVTGLPPPTPPPVPLHAAQHEEDGLDEASIDGLSGKTKDPQSPLAHVASHQAGGTDALNVGALLGELAQDQPTKIHSNTKHDPQMATASALSSHQAAANVHSASTNLEQLEHKGQPNGYAGLDNVGFVLDAQLAPVPTPPPDAGDALTFGSGWSKANPLYHAHTHQLGGLDPLPMALNATGASVTVDGGSGETTIASITVPAGWMNATLGLILNAAGRLTSDFCPGAFLRLKIKQLTPQRVVTFVTLDIDVSMIYEGSISLRALVAAIDYLHVKTYLEFLANEDEAVAQSIGPHVISSGNAFAITAVETTFSLTAEFLGVGLSHRIYIDVSHSWNTGQKS